MSAPHTHPRLPVSQLLQQATEAPLNEIMHFLINVVNDWLIYRLLTSSMPFATITYNLRLPNNNLILENCRIIFCANWSFTVLLHCIEANLRPPKRDHPVNPVPQDHWNTTLQASLRHQTLRVPQAAVAPPQNTANAAPQKPPPQPLWCCHSTFKSPFVLPVFFFFPPLHAAVPHIKT